ncbi:winged helix-turn-helix transcriptional regulator [Pyxidicoccus parkwayensis]|uniref:Winged helix-turn-helix transcriptional regulator n=1 Tax=Pyxidicoccus parkwayensis TaxID=2813578 RepID=A0ABX7PB04_9BACT|nr:metalloregulator ArsR/SmtB family transcription factor [Pyxidicoccus parkwaysis]QSQ27570.1 winged helix-turn-helix transcriptional regulator [Pyxidicoccus parkwaysis]
MQAFTALSDPTRRRIVELLASGERSAGELGESFDISAPAISQHLKVLKEARLVQVRAEAQRRIYTLDTAGFDELEGWVHRIRGFWNERLDVLEQRLAAHPETKKRRRP